MEYDKCVKCGFEPSETVPFNVKYQEKCYNTTSMADCNWMDMDVREHLHVHCPVCGFLVGAKGCLDYKDKKAEKSKAWTPQRENTAVTGRATTGSKFVGGHGYVNPSDKGGWDVNECPQCPMAEGEKTDGENSDVQTTS
jgi:hypothetical protein